MVHSITGSNCRDNTPIQALQSWENLNHVSAGCPLRALQPGVSSRHQMDCNPLSPPYQIWKRSQCRFIGFHHIDSPNGNSALANRDGTQSSQQQQQRAITRRIETSTSAEFYGFDVGWSAFWGFFFPVRLTTVTMSPSSTMTRCPPS